VSEGVPVEDVDSFVLDDVVVSSGLLLGANIAVQFTVVGNEPGVLGAEVRVNGLALLIGGCSLEG